MKTPPLSGAVVGYAGVGLVAVLVVYLILKNAPALARGAARAFGGIFPGAVVGLGEGLGVPPTDLDKCAAARARGDLWAASISCPAGTFLGAAKNKLFGVGRDNPATLAQPTLDRVKPVSIPRTYAEARAQDDVAVRTGVGGTVFPH